MSEIITFTGPPLHDEVKKMFAIILGDVTALWGPPEEIIIEWLAIGTPGEFNLRYRSASTGARGQILFYGVVVPPPNNIPIKPNG